MFYHALSLFVFCLFFRFRVTDAPECNEEMVALPRAHKPPGCALALTISPRPSYVSLQEDAGEPRSQSDGQLFR